MMTMQSLPYLHTIQKMRNCYKYRIMQGDYNIDVCVYV